MEASEATTEKPLVNGSIIRYMTTRRTRNNNSNGVGNTTLEDKDQENATNKTKEKVEVAEESSKEDTNIALINNETKQQTSTTSTHLSTPRRKKDPLANLHSNLSPKYIGFNTPPTQPDNNSNSEERSRNLRRRHNMSNSDTSVNKDSNMSITECPFTPSNDSTLGFVRRAPLGKDSQSTPTNSTRRKDFVSPIDKLLIKNGSMVENNMLLGDCNIYRKEILMKDEENREVDSEAIRNSERRTFETEHEDSNIAEDIVESILNKIENSTNPDKTEDILSTDKSVDKPNNTDQIDEISNTDKINDLSNSDNIEDLSNTDATEDTFNADESEAISNANKSEEKFNADKSITNDIDDCSSISDNVNDLSNTEKTDHTLNPDITEDISNTNKSSKDENENSANQDTISSIQEDRIDVSSKEDKMEDSLNLGKLKNSSNQDDIDSATNEDDIDSTTTQYDIDSVRNEDEIDNASATEDLLSEEKMKDLSTKQDEIDSASNRDEIDIASNRDERKDLTNQEDIDVASNRNEIKDLTIQEDIDVALNRHEIKDLSNLNEIDVTLNQDEIKELTNQDDIDAASNQDELEIQSNQYETEISSTQEEFISIYDETEDKSNHEENDNDENHELIPDTNKNLLKPLQSSNQAENNTNHVNRIELTLDQNENSVNKADTLSNNVEEMQVISSHVEKISEEINHTVNPEDLEEDEEQLSTTIASKIEPLENIVKMHLETVETESNAQFLGATSAKSPSLEEDEEQMSTTIASKIESLEPPCAEEQTDVENIVKMELESVETESNAEFVEATTSAKSPSAISVDSAKGSSILNEGSWMSISTGDLFWGQIFSYCYWPCLVCPDPDGKTITTEDRSGDQHVLVHVRFFADNGRRNWVKRENLMPYAGIESYQERLEEAKEKYGSKSAKFKLYVPTKKKEPVWFEAVNEANIVSEIPYADRLEKFYEIFEKSKAFTKLNNKRRKSMYSQRNSTSDMESLYGSQDNINTLAIPSKLKRERSTSPYSPAYSPIKSVKRRKFSEGKSNDNSIDHHQPNTNNDLNLSQTNSVASSSSTTTSLNDLDMFNSTEFKNFYATMKGFVMEQNQNEKLEKSLVVAVRNIWALKQLSRHQMERVIQEPDSMSSPLTTGNVPQTGNEGSLKRLSTRLKSMMVRKSLVSQQQAQTPPPPRSDTPERSTTPKLTKEKPLLNRPILEVIDDIFELDNKYLFRGMNRDPVCKYCFKAGGNLRRCSKNCNTYLHSECLHLNFTANGKAIKRTNKRVNSIKSIADTAESGDNASVGGGGSLNSSLVDLTENNNCVAHVTGDSSEAEVVCKECTNNEPIKCMVCKCTESTKDDDPLVKCTTSQCDRTFHPGCCKYWPQAKITISKNHIQSFRCPSHVCHTCVSDDPKGKFQHLISSKLTKCVKCPATFHTDSTCIPAGSQILSSAYIICPRHTSMKHDMTVNVNWCFICVGGGQVTCCETCPTAVHAQCLKIPIDPNEGYICEECESGRMPLYGEMVWAKFNSFRWWPAIILPPTEIPKNIAKKTHNPSDFVVRFFGTHDHGWISRRRVYLYLEGDSSEPPKSKSVLDLNYNRGVEEAKEIYEIVKGKKMQQSSTNESKEKLHPQPYVRIKANRAVPPVKLHIDIDSVSKCECNPNEDNPCGPDSSCINRVLYHECNPKICPAGERCQNQMFESRISPRLDVIYMKERGFGLVAREPIMAGSFVIEYVGEIISDNECQARMKQKSLDRDENFYFLSVEKDYIIDAGPKGNLARFMNHSCDPNCETQKWSVNSLNRVGLFAIRDIPENTELTFNYHWDDLLGNEKKTCFCGSKKCAGQIGAKVKDIESTKEHSTSDLVKTKSKTKSKSKSKPVKRLGRPPSNLKFSIKTKTKKKAAVTAVSDLLKTKNKTKSPINKYLEQQPTSSSSNRILKSPDLFD